MTENSEEWDRQSLEFMNLASAMFIAQALEAGLVAFSARTFFHILHEHSQARVHPSHSLTYCALIAAEEQRFVYVVEEAKQYFPKMRTKAPFRRGAELIGHRHAIAHPTNATWAKPWMQSFHDQGRANTDLRAGILWDYQRSLNELTIGAKHGPFNTDIRVTDEMIILLDLIMKCVVKPEFANLVPSPQDSAVVLRDKFRPRYIEMLERHPDGQSHDATDDLPNAG